MWRLKIRQGTRKRMLKPRHSDSYHHFYMDSCAGRSSQDPSELHSSQIWHH
jgi:hypothetical protein